MFKKLVKAFYKELISMVGFMLCLAVYSMAVGFGLTIGVGLAIAVIR